MDSPDGLKQTSMAQYDKRREASLITAKKKKDKSDMPPFPGQISPNKNDGKISARIRDDRDRPSGSFYQSRLGSFWSRSNSCARL